MQGRNQELSRSNRELHSKVDALQAKLQGLEGLLRDRDQQVRAGPKACVLDEWCS